MRRWDGGVAEKLGTQTLVVFWMQALDLIGKDWNAVVSRPTTWSFIYVWISLLIIYFQSRSQRNIVQQCTRNADTGHWTKSGSWHKHCPPAANVETKTNIQYKVSFFPRTKFKTNWFIICSQTSNHCNALEDYHCPIYCWQFIAGILISLESRRPT